MIDKNRNYFKKVWNKYYKNKLKPMQKYSLIKSYRLVTTMWNHLKIMILLISIKMKLCQN